MAARRRADVASSGLLPKRARTSDDDTNVAATARPP